MMIHEITEKVGRYKARKRIGRGEGSGHGGTAGRGHKGAGSRAGHSRRASYEGGQLPWFQRFPKRGFSNAAFTKRYHVINLKMLEERFEDGAEINLEVLASKRLVRDTNLPLKVLGEGELTKKFSVTAAKFSASARTKIEGAGGSTSDAAGAKSTKD
ncbi:MAG: 50S ribosomal protein L15 [Planctomycetota bacterium]|nr:50S ribosomal protein L15 [Planctomycetota bacterium]